MVQQMGIEQRCIAAARWSVRHLKESSYSNSRRVASRRAAKRDRGGRARQPEPKLFRGWGPENQKLVKR